MNSNHPLLFLLKKIRTCSDLRPLVVFDLDSTLFRTAERTLTILKEFDWPDPSIRQKISLLNPEGLEWRYENHLRSFGIADESLLKKVHRFWGERFFQNPYLAYDTCSPGGAEFVRKVIENCGIAVYLSGRDEPNMKMGTQKSLLKYGFPLDGASAMLIMKEKFEITDKDFKESSIQKLRDMGTVVGAIDNQPDLVRLFKSAFPDAYVIFVDSVYPPEEEPPDPGWPTIKTFELPEGSVE